jgi:hypothetical protein
MRFSTYLSLVGVLGLAILSGCGADLGFSSSDMAIQKFANTTWGGTTGGVSLVFDGNAKIIDFTVPNLPPEVQGLNVRGEPFNVTIPANILPPEFSQFAGTYSATLVNTKTTLNSDGSLDVEFAGTANVPLVQSITLKVTGNFVQTGGTTQLTNLTGSLFANFPIVGSMQLGAPISLADGIDVTQLN